MELIEILTPSPAVRWATVAQARTRLGLDVTADTLLGELLDEQSDLANRIVGRPLERQQYRERVGGDGSDLLRVSRVPLEQIDSIVIDTETVATADYEIANSRLGLIRHSSSTWQNTSRITGVVSQVYSGPPQQTYVITYWAGYKMPEDSGAPAEAIELPARFRSAILEMVRGAVVRQDLVIPGIERMRKEGYEVKFSDTALGPIPTAALQILEDESEVIA